MGDLVAARGGWPGRLRLPGLALADTGGPVVYTNQAILFRPVLTADDPLLGGGRRFFAGSPSAMLLSAWPTPDLSVRGWQLIGHPMFVVRAPGPHEVGPPDGPSIVPTHTADQLALAERVVIDGYPLPEAAGLPRHALFGVDLLDGPIRIRVAFVDGAAGRDRLRARRPRRRRTSAWPPPCRSPGAAAPGSRWSGPGWTTRPHLPAVAFTSDDSRPGFVRLGFLPITRFTLWLVPGRP